LKQPENLFAKLVSDFLGFYLPAQRNYSKNTISSYCDTFKVFLQYMKTEHNLTSDRVQIDAFNHNEIVSFLTWLETERNSSIGTINQRLASLHSFSRYVQCEAPQYMNVCQKILGIPLRKKTTPLVAYLCKEDLEAILQQPDTSTKNGRRDLTLLCLLYDTGGRVQEIADLTVSSIRLEPPAQVKIFGKGRKERAVPLMKPTGELLKNYMRENELGSKETLSQPLFFNYRNEKLSRSGISYILQKYAFAAHVMKPTIPDVVRPHMLRHSKAMHMLEADVNIAYIRDILGHTSVSTTQIYAKSNMEMKRKALEKAAVISDSSAPPSWTKKADLMSWLQNYGRSLT
jgi:site-specific recombinase XerD